MYVHAQLCLTLRGPMECNPPGSCPWDFPGKNTGMGCHFFLQGIFQHTDWILLSCNSCIGRSFLTTAPPGTMACRALRIWHLPTLAISGPINPLPAHYFSATRASLLFLKHINHTTTLGALWLLGIPSLRSSHAHSLPSFKSSMVAKEIPWTIIYKIGPPMASSTKPGFVVLYYLITWTQYLFYHPHFFFVSVSVGMLPWKKQKILSDNIGEHLSEPMAYLFHWVHIVPSYPRYLEHWHIMFTR